MRNWLTGLSLISLVPLGFLLAGRGPNDVILRTFPPRSRQPLPSGESPSVQFVAAASESANDPLISPIIIDEPAVAPPAALTFDFTHDARAIFHPHGEQICASGCAASRHPTETLTRNRFDSLLLEYAHEPLGGAGPAQDALLYYGRQAAQLFATEGVGRLDPIRAAVLKHELARDHAEIEIRVVDALDRVRAELPITNVPLDRRHEFDLDTHNLQPMIASGTVKRVGRDFLWTRL